jgi:hypothetical protein
MSNAPVETKVKAATAAGAGSAAVLTPFVIWVVDQMAFNGDAAPDVPLPVVGVIGLVVTGVCTFAAGWYARHSPRFTGEQVR